MTLSERFYSLQGEGVYTGMPSIFLRASTCNLRCNGKWKCDTWALLSKGEEFDVGDIVAWLVDNGYYYSLAKGHVHLVLTGGEPFHPDSAKAFTQLVRALKMPGICFTEIETNGTLMDQRLFQTVDHITCSPKLVGSGMPLASRYKLQILEKIMTHRSYCFKFVIADAFDMKEAEKYIEEVGIPADKVFLMPAAGDRATLIERLPYVWRCCEKYGYRLSTRLHITAFDKKVGI